MGFRTTRKTYQLVFPEGDPLHGLEITVRGLTLGEFNDLRNKSNGEPDAFDRKSIEVAEFLDRVVGWNLEDEDGNPLKVGEDAFNQLGPAETSDILKTWLTVALGGTVSRPLDEQSNGGGSSDPTPNGLESIPMESM